MKNIILVISLALIPLFLSSQLNYRLYSYISYNRTFNANNEEVYNYWTAENKSHPNLVKMTHSGIGIGNQISRNLGEYSFNLDIMEAGLDAGYAFLKRRKFESKNINEHKVYAITYIGLNFKGILIQSGFGLCYTFCTPSESWGSENKSRKTPTIFLNFGYNFSISNSNLSITPFIRIDKTWIYDEKGGINSYSLGIGLPIKRA